MLLHMFQLQGTQDAPSTSRASQLAARRPYAAVIRACGAGPKKVVSERQSDLRMQAEILQQHEDVLEASMVELPARIKWTCTELVPRRSVPDLTGSRLAANSQAKVSKHGQTSLRLRRRMARLGFKGQEATSIESLAGRCHQAPPDSSLP